MPEKYSLSKPLFYHWTGKILRVIFFVMLFTGGGLAVGTVLLIGESPY